MHVFVSYVREDSPIVNHLVDYLRSYSVRVWIDRDNLTPGQRWPDTIKKAIQSGDFFIACFSGNYLKRDKSFMNEELNIAIEELRLRPFNRSWFIPVLLSECIIPDIPINFGETIKNIQMAKLFENDFITGARAILNVVSPFAYSSKLGNDILWQIDNCDDWNDITNIYSILTSLTSTDITDNAALEICKKISKVIPNLRPIVVNFVKNEVPNERIILLLGILCDPNSIAESFPDLLEKCNPMLFVRTHDVLFRPFYSWDFPVDVFNRLHTLWMRNLKPESTLPQALKSLEICSSCNHCELVTVIDHEHRVYDGEHYWYDEYECAFCGNSYTSETDWR